MTSKPTLKSPELFGDRYPPSSDQNKSDAVIRRRAWRCVRPVLREPDCKALRQLERIDPAELTEITEEALKGLEDHTGKSGCRTPAEKRRDLLHMLAWTHYVTGLYGRTEADLSPTTKVKLAEMQRLLKTMIRML